MTRLLVIIVAGMGFLFDLLGAAHGELMNQMALAAAGSVSFAITVPTRIESLIVLALSLSVALVSLGLLRLRTTRKTTVEP